MGFFFNEAKAAPKKPKTISKAQRATIPWAAELCEMWLREMLDLPWHPERMYQGEYPKGRPTTFHRMVKLNDDERRYVEDLRAKHLDPTVPIKDPGWNLLPGEIAPEPDVPE